MKKRMRKRGLSFLLIFVLCLSSSISASAFGKDETEGIDEVSLDMKDEKETDTSVEPEVPGSEEEPEIKEPVIEGTEKELQKEEAEVQEISQEPEETPAKTEEKTGEKAVRAAVNGVMEIDISQGPVVITNEGFAQENNQYFNPDYDRLSSLASFTAWTGPYRIKGTFNRVQDGTGNSGQLVSVLGGSSSDPISIELENATLNNKKDDNNTSSGSAIAIGDFQYHSTTGTWEAITGAVDLKLNGANMVTGSALNSGIEVYRNSWLRISGNGSLDVSGGKGSAGIGGAMSSVTPYDMTIIIDGGTIRATGGEDGAGIGGGRITTGGTIKINDGDITATGGRLGAGIGGGLISSSSDMGPLDIQINGGTVHAAGGEAGAGIGGGYVSGRTTSISEMSIQIGGTADVTAVGGLYGNSTGAAGIGAGCTAQSDTSPVNPNVVVKKIEISGGKVFARGATCAAGIGSSSGNHTDTILISGGEVEAEGGGYGAGIGTGYAFNIQPKKSTAGNIEITGGTLKVSGGENAAGIGSGSQQGKDSSVQNVGNIRISGGDVKTHGGIYGPGIGSGVNTQVGDITITAGTVASRGGKNGAGIGTAHSGTAGNIAIKGGKVSAATDFEVREDNNHDDGCAAGVGGGVDGIVKSISITGDAELLAIAGPGGAGIGRGLNSHLEVPVIPITIEGAPNITAYAVGTTENGGESGPWQAIDYEGVQSCSTNILLGHFKAPLDEAEKAFKIIGDSDQSEYNLLMPERYQSFAVTTTGAGIHRVFVDDKLYEGSAEKGSEETLISKLQVEKEAVNAYWYLQPASDADPDIGDGDGSDTGDKKPTDQTPAQDKVSTSKGNEGAVSKTVKTGDNVPVIPFVIAGGAALLAAIVLLVCKRKRHSDR